MMKNFIPEGVADLNYDDFEKIKAAEESLLSVFRQDGYRQIMTPTFEYYDLFADDSIFAGTEDMQQAGGQKRTADGSPPGCHHSHRPDGGYAL